MNNNRTNLLSIDIIIVNYNSTSYLLKCLESIYADIGNVDLTVRIVDNNSQNSVEQVSRAYPQVDLIQNTTNVGFAAAINQGIKSSRSKYLMFLNPDTIISPVFFRPMIDYMENHPRTGIIGPKILDTDGTIQGSARAFPNALTALYGRSSPLTKYFPNNPVSRSNIMTMDHHNEDPLVVDWVSGACMMVRAQAIAEVGLLDRRFFMYWEDADLCRRMWQNNWKVIYLPIPTLHHHIGKSSDSRPLRSIYHFHRSSFLLFEKYTKGVRRTVLPLAVIALIARGIMIGCWKTLNRRIFRSMLLKIFFVRRVSNRQKPVVDMSTPHKIKILRIISRINIGGPAIHISLLQKAFNNEVFESTLISGSLSPHEGDMGYILSEDPTRFRKISEMQRELNPWKDLMAFLKLFLIIKRTNPDIVHSHTAKAGTITRSSVFLHNLLFKKQVKTVHTFHGHVFEGYFNSIKSRLFIWSERLLATATDKIIAISTTQREDLVNRYRIANDEKFETIKLGFNLDPFIKNNTSKGHFRKELGIDTQTRLVGIIGRLVPVKNHTMFLQAVKHFMQQYQDGKILFAVIGDGELRENLETFCHQEGISQHVRFCGWIKDIQYVYADLDVLVLTSINEGTPVSIIEAMASGVPVISTDVGGIKDLLGNSVDMQYTGGFKRCERGLLIPKTNYQVLSNGIRYILDHPDTVHQQLVPTAHKFIVSNYHQDRLVNDIRSLYHRLLNQPELSMRNDGE
jgi:GT2 family glycosyltransferase/glycosyltransferase involved in cell wall biosynthesis